MTIIRNNYSSGSELAEALAGHVAAKLDKAIETKGRASIAVSGGSTPKAFFKALSNCTLDWSCVTVTLVDERFVPLENPRSNHFLVRENLLQNKAANARFIPLFHDGVDAEAAASLAAQEAADIFSPFDVVILGMGNDGHTASFFPGGSNLAIAIDASQPKSVVTMEAEGAGETRLTFNFSALQDAALLVLHIEGDAKAETLEKALGDGPEEDMPVRAVLRRAASPTEIYWAP